MEKSVVFNNRLLPYLLLVPQLIITFVFFYWPASQAVWQSFQREDAFGLNSEFIGLENYQALFAQPEYYKSMLTTAIFSTLVAALSLSIALLFATQADKNLKAAGTVSLAIDFADNGFPRQITATPALPAPVIECLKTRIGANPANANKSATITLKLK